MPTNVDVPPLGESVSEAVLLRWLKNDGEYVTTDEPVCELETDKANVDLAAKAPACSGTPRPLGNPFMSGKSSDASTKRRFPRRPRRQRQL